MLKVGDVAPEFILPDENGNGENGAESLPDLVKDEKLKLIKLEPTQSFTKPPARYSEAMLVKRLEADGIGRPSTYASIITTLKDRKYVELLEKKLPGMKLETGATIEYLMNFLT